MWDAIVLAGGAGRRLGGLEAGVVKPEVVVAGRALVDHALAAVAQARRRVLVAPDALARPDVPTTLEDPPLGGPVAGIAAGLALLEGLEEEREHGAADVVVVLACDVPRAGLVVGALVAAAQDPGVDGARLVDDEGHPQHLVAAYRRTALVRALAALRAGADDADDVAADHRAPAHDRGVRGASVRRLVATLRLADVPDPGGAAADADTWPAIHRLDAELASAAPDRRGETRTTERADAHPEGGTIREAHSEPRERHE